MFGYLPVCLFVLQHLSGCFHAMADRSAERRIGRYNRPTQRPKAAKLYGSNTAYEWPQARMYPYDTELGIMYRRAANDQCSVCIADKDCFVFNSERCDYYLETSKILPDGEKLEETDPDLNPQLKAEVDSMMFSVIEKAKADSTYQDCIPYVSKYTDCSKDTICTGCKTCDCDSSGRWSCSIEQTCRPDLVKPTADHRTLFMVLQSLKQDNQNDIQRAKRSLDDREYDDDLISHAKLAEWIYSEPTLNVDSIEKTMYEHHYKNLEPTTSLEHNKNYNQLLKFVVNTLIHDTLPGIFKGANLNFENNRVRRWLTNDSSKVESKKPNITFEELSDWLNIVHPYVITTDNNNNTNGDTKKNTSVENNKKGGNLHMTEKASVVGEFSDPALSHTDPEYLAFEEVYNNIAVDNKNYSRRKPLLDMKHNKDDDTDFHMYDDKYYYEEVATPSTRSLDPNVRNLVEELGVTLPPELNAVTEDITDYYLDTVTEVVVDLLETAKNNKLTDVNTKDDLEVKNKIENSHFTINDLNVVNIMKRDVSQLNESHLNSTNIEALTSVNELKEGVLSPIDKLLKDKETEIEELIKIRDNLIHFLNTHKDSDTTKSKKNYLSVYQVDFLPRHSYRSHRFRTSNISLLDTYVDKLKHDVYEVIRDVVAIKRLYNDSSKVPDNLNYLIKSLKHYIHKQGFYYRKEPNLRRSYNKYDSVKTAIIKVIELLDRNKPKTNALTPISPYTKRIFKRIIKRNYVDEFSGTGLRVYDPHYNLTNDLKTIGTKWKLMLSKIETSSAFDRLYNIKNLHLLLSVDMAKMNDALALVDFARSRRMIPVDDVLATGIVININKGIMWMKSVFDDVISSYTKRSNPLETNPYVSPEVPQLKHNSKKHKKKESFLMQIKTLLQNSKNDIMKLLHRKVPKTDIVKEIARKNIEKMTSKKLENTMLKWQTNLNILRKKRSANAFDSLKRRMASIIPKYLRGKVDTLPMSMKMGKNKKKNNTNTKYKKKVVANTTTATTRRSKVHLNQKIYKFTTRLPTITARLYVAPTVSNLTLSK